MTEPVLAAVGPAPAWLAGPDVARRSGLERIEAFASGAMPLPPAYLLVGMRPTVYGAGHVTYRLDPSAWLRDADGEVDRAALAYFVDAPVANAIHSELAPQVTLRTVSLGIEFAGGLPWGDHPVICEGSTLGAVDRAGLATATMTLDGALIASATCHTVSMDHPSNGDAVRYPRPTAAVPPRLPPPVRSPARRGSGLDRVTGMIEDPDTRPAFWTLAGMAPTLAGEGRISMAMAADPWLSSPAGLLYGGALSGFGVSALQTALWSADAAGENTRMLGVRYEFTRMVPHDGSTVTAESHLIHRGRTMAIADVVVTDAAGRRAGIGRATGLVERT